MHTLPQSFFFFTFLPEFACAVKCVCDPTTLDPATAEVGEAMPSEESKRSLRALPAPASQRRIDEAASTALEFFCARLGAGDSLERAEARVEAESLRLALAAQGCWNETQGYAHPEDEGGPLWHPHN